MLLQKWPVDDGSDPGLCPLNILSSHLQCPPQRRRRRRFGTCSWPAKNVQTVWTSQTAIPSQRSTLSMIHLRQCSWVEQSWTILQKVFWKIEHWRSAWTFVVLFTRIISTDLYRKASFIWSYTKSHCIDFSIYILKEITYPVFLIQCSPACPTCSGWTSEITRLHLSLLK